MHLKQRKQKISNSEISRRKRKKRTRQRIAVFDFFCGCGGTSAGFKESGMDIAFALDIDQDAKDTFTKNFPEADFCDKSISKVTDTDLESTLSKHKGKLKLFCGCAPCQPFTKQNTESPKYDTRRSLLSQFGLVIQRHIPDFVFVENVPGLQKVPTHKRGPFPAFLNLLAKLKYHIDFGVVAAQDYGTPQLRRRFVLLASKHGEIRIPNPTHGLSTGLAYNTVYDAIYDLPPINAGEEYVGQGISNHRAADLSPINLNRIQATSHDGGGRNDWPKSLWPNCYKRRLDGSVHTGHTDCYGRLWWDRPATGLTTRCISYSNGRFGHPEQDRALSVREAARLQGFNDNFEFEGSLNSMAKQIGNAVPVDLATAMGKNFIKHKKELDG